jgi:hypothetical protein
MEEKLNLVERALMSEEEFKKYLGNKADIVEDSLTVENPLTETLNLRDYRAVGKFKSIRRAIRRGLVSPSGTICPKRSFNNRANTSRRKGHHSRVMNEVKKSIYEQLKHRRAECL